jgi:hypothetical protein
MGHRQADFACLANVPVAFPLTLPAVAAIDGLPIRVQIIAPEGHEAGPVARTRMIDAKLSAYCAPPSMENSHADHRLDQRLRKALSAATTAGLAAAIYQLSSGLHRSTSFRFA